jgi:hypothetical protein
MNNKIAKAISNKQVIQFYYEGGIRIVEPHCYGLHKTTGGMGLWGQAGLTKSSPFLPSIDRRYCSLHQM